MAVQILHQRRRFVENSGILNTGPGGRRGQVGCLVAILLDVCWLESTPTMASLQGCRRRDGRSSWKPRRTTKRTIKSLARPWRGAQPAKVRRDCGHASSQIAARHSGSDEQEAISCNGMLVLFDSAPNLDGSLPIGWHLSRRRGDSSGFLPRPENLESVPGLIGSLDERSKVWKRVALRRASARACLTPCSSPADPLRVPC